jgi:hypothetical protein
VATVRRHWVVAVACLVATVAVAAVVYLRVPVYYTTQTQLVVLSPAARADSNGDLVAFNPYLTAGDGPSQVMASALQRVAVSPSFEVALANRGVSSEYSVAVATSGGGVVLEVVTVALNPTTALNDLNTAAKLLNETLVKQQLDAGSPENQLLTMRDLVGPSQPSPLPGDRMKLAGIAGVLGLVLTGLMMTVLAARSRRGPAVPLPPASTAPAAGSAPPPPSTPAPAMAQPGGDPPEHGRRRTDRASGRRDDPQRRVDDVPGRPDEPPREPPREPLREPLREPVRGQRRPEEPTTPQRPPGEARRPDDQRRRPSDVEETVAMPKVTAEALRNAAERSRGPVPKGPVPGGPVAPSAKPGGPAAKPGGPVQSGPVQSGPGQNGPGQNGPVPAPKWPEQQPSDAGR